MQHRKVKNPQAFTLSVDLFGPMPASEKGRDEQSISGNPHLRFGLVGVFRLPKQWCRRRLSLREPGPDDQEELAALGEEYEPSEPGEVLSDEMIEKIRSGYDADGIESLPLADYEDDTREAEPVGDLKPQQGESPSEGPGKDELQDTVKDLMSGVELATLPLEDMF